jgi:hypothetical protein
MCSASGRAAAVGAAAASNIAPVSGWDRLLLRLPVERSAARCPSRRRDTLVAASRSPSRRRDTLVTASRSPSRRRDTLVTASRSPSRRRDTLVTASRSPSRRRDTLVAASRSPGVLGLPAAAVIGCRRLPSLAAGGGRHCGLSAGSRCVALTAAVGGVERLRADRGYL